MRFTLLALLAGSVRAGTIVWDGRFNDMSSSADLNTWSWSNQVGPYQYYIHGSGAVSKYVNLSPDYKNPADGGSKQGAKFTLDSTAYWNGQNMRRTELIPQTKAAIASGKLFYHFSIKRSNTNAPSIYREHQICFFESHFVELKSGWISGASGNSDTNLRFYVGGQSKWNTVWDADVWHNVAYEIDFSGNKVGFWHSTGSDPLVQTVAPVSASTSSNGQDWHLGVLELPVSGRSDSDEDFYFSGVYIESGSITTSVAGPGGAVVGQPSGMVTSTKVATPTNAPVETNVTPTPAGTLAQYVQCGGAQWTGSGTCVEGTKCVVTNEYYSQCL
ncbi:Cellulose-binding protein [Venustampulla echinocandica]|uniref:Cellulose-binding protein n=1 Tax=Venustampulla echinocandica TaxID=2656787 RepID=A0A370TPY1_9HELO|nr:Cellulose-binding protein [Venustampulla echinocandica]RDL37581.1 Cellulose-binding protein [Venustampulla echinocandica]